MKNSSFEFSSKETDITRNGHAKSILSIKAKIGAISSGVINSDKLLMDT